MQRNELERNLIGKLSIMHASEIAEEWDTVLDKVKHSALRELMIVFRGIVKDFKDNTYIPLDSFEISLINYERDEPRIMNVEGIYVTNYDNDVDIKVDTDNGCDSIDYYCTDDIIRILKYAIQYVEDFCDDIKQ